MRRLLAALFTIAASSIACASAPPTPPPNNSPIPPNADTAPLQAPTTVAKVAPDCPVHQKSVPLGPDRVLRCRGIPFNITFPKGAQVTQIKVGPGTSFMGVLKPAGAVAIAMRPAIFETITTNDPQQGLDRTMDLVVKGLTPSARVDKRYDVTLGPSSIAGRAMDFSYPLDTKKVAGTMRAFLVGGWVVTLATGGPENSPLSRGNPDATAFLDSLRVAPIDPTPVVVSLEGGARLNLPPDAWLNEDRQEKLAPGVLRVRTYALPDVSTLLTLEEQNLGGRRCTDVMAEQPSRQHLERELRSSLDLTIRSLERRTVASSQTIFVDVAKSTEAGKLNGTTDLPASVALFCKEPTLLMAITMGTRPRAELRAVLESVLATYQMRTTAQEVAHD